MIQLKDIHENPNNPRIIKDINFQKLVQSIKTFPKMMELRPIVVDKDGIVQGGNMRRAALIAAGYTEVPEAWIKYAEDFTPEELKEFIIKDNVSFGEWNWDALKSDIDMGWDLELLSEWGLDLPEVNLNDLDGPAATQNAGTRLSNNNDDGFIQPDDTDTITTDIVVGDLFEIGNHKLLCGDSTKPETFAKLFGKERARLVVTDPPYNVAYVGKTKKALTIDGDKQSDSGFYDFLFDFYCSLGEYCEPGASWYVWHADSEGANFRQAMKDAGIMVKQCLIWVKQTMVFGRQDYQWKHEPCLYGWKEGAAHNWYSDRKQTTVLNFDRPFRNEEHPTMKPIPLFSYQIENSSKEGDIVADGFGGSGTTMVACEMLNRKARIVEFDPRYCQVIIDRMIKLNPTLTVRKNGVDL